jgi:hypothetical protein
MKFVRLFISVICLTILITRNIYAQKKSHYDQPIVFDPIFLNQPGTSFRNGSGAQGPQYWQNKANCKISAKLNPNENESNAEKGRIKLPVEFWQSGGKWNINYNSTANIDSDVMDPDHMLPDVDTYNNRRKQIGFQ